MGYVFLIFFQDFFFALASPFPHLILHSVRLHLSWLLFNTMSPFFAHHFPYHHHSLSAFHLTFTVAAVLSVVVCCRGLGWEDLDSLVFSHRLGIHLRWIHSIRCMFEFRTLIDCQFVSVRGRCRDFCPIDQLFLPCLPPRSCLLYFSEYLPVCCSSTSAISASLVCFSHAQFFVMGRRQTQFASGRHNKKCNTTISVKSWSAVSLVVLLNKQLLISWKKKLHL